MVKKYQAPATSKGIGIGKAYFYNKFTPQIERITIPESNIESEISKFYEVKKDAISEINRITEMIGSIDLNDASIFRAQIEIINDPVIGKQIIDEIKTQKVVLSYAIYAAYEVVINILENVDSPIIKERISDMLDVRDRLLRNYEGIPEYNLSHIDKEVVVVSRDILPSNLALINKKYIKGIITENGTNQSHLAILTKNYGIPAFLGIGKLIENINFEDDIIVDGVDNEIIINPTNDILNEYLQKKEKYDQEQIKLQEYLHLPSYTKDGIKIDVCLNINSSNKEELKYFEYVDGIGLYRTEYLYSTKLPTVLEQVAYYKKILTLFNKKEVTIRTADIGADKKISYLDVKQEINPALGNRGIRLGFSNEKLLKDQVKALLMANEYNNLNVMFPMVSSYEEVIKIKKIIDDCEKELIKDKIPFNKFKVGIMIEVPSVAIMIESIIEEIDFASIGTNDLTQYLLAVDRIDENMDAYYQRATPSLFRLINNCVSVFEKHNKPLSLCGEIGADEDISKILIGLGLTKISVSGNFVPIIKKNVVESNYKDLKEFADEILKLRSETEIINKIKTKKQL